MKYIRIAISIILSAVFIAAVIIGASVIFAVRNINVAAVSYSSSAGDGTEFSDSVTEIKSKLSSLNGKNLLGIEEGDVSSLMPEGGYAEFVSFEKVYPCTLNITLEERLETYAVMSSDGKYLVYDEQGEYIITKTDNVNNLDGCPNVIVSYTAGDICDIAEAAMYFKEEYSSLRSVVQSITVAENVINDCYDLTFSLYCGATLRVIDYIEYTAEKIHALCEAFDSLDDYYKTCGEVSCRSGSSGIYITLPDGSFYKV